MHPNFAGALLNAALYLLCVFVAGLVTAHPVASKAAVAAMGITYVAHVLHYMAAQGQDPDHVRLANYIVVLSVIAGAVAGFALLF